MKEKDISDLISRYEHMLASGKNIYFDADEFDELAEYFEKDNEIETAKEIVNRGLMIHPDSETLILRHAAHLVFDSNYTAALEFLNKRIQSYNLDSFLLKTECFLHLGLYAEAHVLTKNILEQETDELDIALSELGAIYLDAEYYKEAILYLEKSLAYNNANLDVLNDLAYAYETQSDFESIIRVCEQILDIDPYSFNIWTVLGKSYSIEGEYEKAIDAFDFALTLDDNNISVLKLKIHCLMLSGRYDEAIKILQDITAIDVQNETLALSLIDCYISVEEYPSALEEIAKYEEIFGSSTESISKRAYIYFLMGKTDLAVETIGLIAENDIDVAETNIIVGEIYMQAGLLTKADYFLNRALSLKNKDNIEILEKLVSLYIKKEEIVRAIEYQKQIIAQGSSFATLEKLALLYMEGADRESFEMLLDTFSTQELVSFLRLFYPNEPTMPSGADRIYTLNRINDIYESRLLYKNLKF